MTATFDSAMRQAMGIAAEQYPHPNPRVGAVILAKDGSLISEGAHVKPGTPHAERLAIEAAEGDLLGATIVVSLEPCVHHGLTPPCTDAIIQAGISRVVIGSLDPDERVRGRSIEILRAAGIEVISGVLADEIVAIDPAYFHQRRTGFPLVTLKTAITLDGQTAAADRSSQWITSEPARQDAHRMRSEHDAVLIGAGTLRSDDPRLDVRLAGYKGPQPVPVIVAGNRPLLDSAELWQRSPIVLAPGPLQLPTGVLVVVGDAGIVDLKQGMVALTEHGVLSVLVEGGSGIAASLWSQGLITRGSTYIGARMAGGLGSGMFDAIFATMADSVELVIDDVVRVGPDLRIDWHPL